jgi:hypothetical protein
MVAEREGHVPNQLRLARQADVKMTSQLVPKLEDKELLRREADQADTPGQETRPHRRRQSVARHAIAAVEHVDVQFFGAETATITPVLQRLVGRLGKPPG